MGLEDVLEGTLGFFHNWSGEESELETDPERGYARRDQGWVAVDLLDEDPMTSLQSWGRAVPDNPPVALVGVMPTDAAVFLEIRGPLGSLRLGGQRASSKRYLARTVVGNVQLDRLRTPALREIHAYFHGIGRWAGMSASNEDFEQEEGRAREWSMTLSGSETESNALPRGRRIEVSTKWSVDGPEDRRTISAPVTMGCVARRPMHLWELLQPVLQMQDLVCFAFDGFVAADGGSAQIDAAPPDDERMATTPSLWNGALMIASPAAKLPRSMNERPLFQLATIGGIVGLARWIRLTSTYPRATRSIVGRYREGRASHAVTLMEIAAAIEVWVKANRPARWAQTASGSGFVKGVAGRSGRPFADWVGDVDAWARDFWRTYNHLKHEPTYVPDPLEVADLAESARYLLAATVLDRASHTKAPSRAIFRHFRLNGLGARLRERYS